MALFSAIKNYIFTIYQHVLHPPSPTTKPPAASAPQDLPLSGPDPPPLVTPCHTPQPCLNPPSSSQTDKTSLTFVPPLDTQALKNLHYTPSGGSYNSILPVIALHLPRYNLRVTNQSPAMADCCSTVTREIQTDIITTREVQTNIIATWEVQTDNTSLTLVPPLDTQAPRQNLITPSGESCKSLPDTSLHVPRYNLSVTNQHPATADPEVQTYHTAKLEVQTARMDGITGYDVQNDSTATQGAHPGNKVTWQATELGLPPANGLGLPPANGPGLPPANDLDLHPVTAINTFALDTQPATETLPAAETQGAQLAAETQGAQLAAEIQCA